MNILQNFPNLSELLDLCLKLNFSEQCFSRKKLTGSTQNTFTVVLNSECIIISYENSVSGEIIFYISMYLRDSYRQYAKFSDDIKNVMITDRYNNYIIIDLDSRCKIGVGFEDSNIMLEYGVSQEELFSYMLTNDLSFLNLEYHIFNDMMDKSNELSDNKLYYRTKININESSFEPSNINDFKNMLMTISSELKDI